MATQSILIRGGGLAGWLTAHALSLALGVKASITLLEYEGDDAPSPLDHVCFDGESPLMGFSPITAEQLALAGGFSLGTRLEGFTRSPQPLFHAPSETLPPMAGFAVHDLIIRLAQAFPQSGGADAMMRAVRFQARVAEEGRFTPPAEDRRSPRSLLRAGIQVNGRWLAAQYRNAALAQNVALIKSETDAPQQPLLIIETRKQSGEWQDLTELLGFDRCITAHADHDGPLPPYMISSADADGIYHRLRAKEGSVSSLTYNSAQLTGEAAQAKLAGHDQSWSPGIADTPWQDNIIYLGAAAMRLGPLFGFDATLLGAQLQRLVRLLPADADQIAVSAAEYNARVHEDFWHLAEFAALPIILNAREEPYWAARRATAKPARLDRRLNQYEARGRIVHLDGDPFDVHVWQEMLIGLGIIPKRTDPGIDSLDMTKIMRQLGAMVDSFEQTIAGMPSHEDFIDHLRARAAQRSWMN